MGSLAKRFLRKVLWKFCGNVAEICNNAVYCARKFCRNSAEQNSRKFCGTFSAMTPSRMTHKMSELLNDTQSCFREALASSKVLSAFKIACLQYCPSPVEYQQQEHSRLELLQQMRAVVGRARQMYAKGICRGEGESLIDLTQPANDLQARHQFIDLQTPPACNLIPPKRTFWTFELTFGVIFSGGPKWHFSDFKMRFWGFGVPGLSVAGRGVCKFIDIYQPAPKCRGEAFFTYSWSFFAYS